LLWSGFRSKYKIFRQLIEILSASLPPNWIIYVKEHPMQWIPKSNSLLAISKALDPELDEALKQIESETNVKAVYVVDSFGALYSEEIHYLVEKYKKTVCLWGKEGGDVVRGSCRGNGTVNIVNLMREVEKDFFLNFGGHVHAGGFSIEHEHIHILELSHHGQAMTDPAFITAWEERGQPQECLPCHTTGYDKDSGTWAADGIVCEACHAPLATNHPEQPMPTDRSVNLCGTCHQETVFISKKRFLNRLTFPGNTLREFTQNPRVEAIFLNPDAAGAGAKTLSLRP